MYFFLFIDSPASLHAGGGQERRAVIVVRCLVCVCVFCCRCCWYSFVTANRKAGERERERERGGRGGGGERVVALLKE